MITAKFIKKLEQRSKKLYNSKRLKNVPNTHPIHSVLFAIVEYDWKFAKWLYGLDEKKFDHVLTTWRY